MKYILIIMCILNTMVYAENTIQVLEWDDVYIIINDSNETRIDCVPDYDTTPDIIGFCNVMQSTYEYCDEECMVDKTIQNNTSFSEGYE